MSTTAERLRQALRIRGMKQSELAALTGIGKSSISTYLSGTYLPKQQNIYKMAGVLDVNEAWLMGHDVSMERMTVPAAPPDSIPSNVIPFGYAEVPPMQAVPLVGDIACGRPITAEENIRGQVSVPSYWGASFVLTCHGDSMAPKIQDGDLVAIHSQPEVENGQIAAVRIDGEATLKRVYRYPDRLELRAINPDFESIFLFGEEINNAEIDGRAIGLCRGL